MTKPLRILALALMLAGCQADRAARDDARCQSYGAKPGTDAYVSCRVGMQQIRSDRASRIAAANIIAD